MIHPLIFLHATLGEIGAIAYLWVFVECLNPSDTRVRRAKIAAAAGVICLFGAWLAGGFYYVDVYGAEVKPGIVASDAKWVHSIVMEVKEHVFLFLPVLAIVTTSLMYSQSKNIIENEDPRKTLLLLSGLIFLMGFAMAGMGAIIASGYRFALEAGLT